MLLISVTVIQQKQCQGPVTETVQLNSPITDLLFTETRQNVLHEKRPVVRCTFHYAKQINTHSSSHIMLLHHLKKKNPSGWFPLSLEGFQVGLGLGMQL